MRRRWASPRSTRARSSTSCGRSPRRRRASPFAGLTPRELDVLRLVARGMGNKQIAAALNLSVGTVKGYVSAILPKIHAGDRTQAALFAVKHGLEDARP